MHSDYSKRTIRWIIIGTIAGAGLGLLIGEQSSTLGIVGKLYIQLLKAFAIPLVLFSILDALVTTHIRIKQASHLLMIVVINAAFATIIGISLSNIFKPGLKLGTLLTNGIQPGEAPKAVSIQEIIGSYVPTSLVQPFIDNNVIGVVIIALLVGVGLRSATVEGSPERDLTKRLLSIFLEAWGKVIRILTALVPLAVFAVTARTVGEHGFKPFVGLAWYIGVGALGLFLQSAIIYPIWVKYIAKIPIKDFIKAAREPVVMAFGTNSSLATLPATLHALDNLGIEKSSSRLGACIGTNLNNDGILLYEAMAVLFVAQAYGIELSVVQQFGIAILAVVAAIGVAGIPEAGVVSLSLVLTTVGLPIEILPLLLTVDWLIARLRSVVNVLADMTVSVALHGLKK